MAWLQLLTGIALAQTSATTSEGDFLKRFEGEWESHETTKGASGKEMPFVLKGKNRWILEGRFLQIDESFKVEGTKYANHILMTFDEAAKKYRLWWFSNGSSNPIVFTGERADQSLTMVQDAGRLRIRYDFVKDGRYKAKLEVKRGEEWTEQTVAEYVRKKK